MSGKTRLLVAICAMTLCGRVSAAQADSTEPQIFAPGVISGPGNDNCPSFTPDGDTVYFDAWPIIFVSHRRHGVWLKPQIAAFSGVWGDHDPAISPDGSYIIYASNHSVDASGKPLDVTIKGELRAGLGNNLWRVDRVGNGWGVPKHLPATVNTNARTYAPSIAGDGTLYFTSRGEDGASHIFRSFYRSGSYQPAERLVLGDPAMETQDPAIAPDQSFIVFNANAPNKTGLNDFYIAFRAGDGWGKPIDMGEPINDKAGKWNQWGAHLGPDRRTLYYTSDRSIRPSFPLTPAQARQQLARSLSWDHGGYHVWSISLTRWLSRY